MGLAFLRAVKDRETVFVAMAMSFHEVLVTLQYTPGVPGSGVQVILCHTATSGQPGLET